jgi:hypothetical protein
MKWMTYTILVDDDVLNALREENPSHPICVLEEDVYTNNVPQGTHDILKMTL